MEKSIRKYCNSTDNSENTILECFKAHSYKTSNFFIIFMCFLKCLFFKSITLD